MKSRIKPQPQFRTGGSQSKFKPQPGYIRLTFTLTHADFLILQKCTRERGLAEDGHSTALRLILREWKAWKDRQHHPVLIAVPPDDSPTQVKADEGK